MAARSWNPFVRFPWTSLLVSLALCVPFVNSLLTFEVASEIRALLQGDERNLASYEKARAILAESEAIVISLGHEQLFSPAGLDAVRRVSETLNALPGVIDVRSLTHAVKPVRRGMSFEMVPLVSLNPSPAEIEIFRAFCLSHPLVKNVMVAEDAQHTLIVATRSQKAVSSADQALQVRALNLALDPFRREGLSFHLLSVPLIEEEIRQTLRRDLGRFVPATALAIVVLLMLTLRSGGLVILVLANQALALSLLPGLITLTGLRLNLFTVMLLPLLAGIHLTLLIHVANAFQQACARGILPTAALDHAIQSTARPCLFASLTTFLGLLSLALSPVSQLREFGLLGALGVTTVHLFTFGPTLATLGLYGRLSRRHSRCPIQASDVDCIPHSAWSARFLPAVLRHRHGILTLVTGVVLAGGISLPWIRTDLRAVEFLDPRSPTRQALEELDRIYGGINVVQIEFETGEADGVNHLEFLQYLDQVQRQAEAEPQVSGAYSYAQLIAMIHQVWEGGAANALRLPDQPWLLQLFVLALKSYDFPFLTGLADSQFRSAFLILRTRDLPSEHYLALIDRIVRYAEENRPEGVRLSAAAGIHSILEADRKIFRSLFDSSGITVCTIWLALACLWRSPRLATLAILTNLVPLAAVVIVARVLGIPLNSVTVMVAAITLGITVDDSVHFLTHWRAARQRGLSNHEATSATLQAKGRAIIATSLVLTAVSTLFWISSFPPVVDFGLLSAVAFSSALAAVLVLLPLLLRMGEPPFQTETSGPTT